MLTVDSSLEIFNSVHVFWEGHELKNAKKKQFQDMSMTLGKINFGEIQLFFSLKIFSKSNDRSEWLKITRLVSLRIILIKSLVFWSFEKIGERKHKRKVQSKDFVLLFLKIILVIRNPVFLVYIPFSLIWNCIILILKHVSSIQHHHNLRCCHQRLTVRDSEKACRHFSFHLSFRKTSLL